ncbi:PREDICTED: protein aubergine isoform X2 [Polistes dominula]|uniref:Protein aubergine isoform X2 n=1 Tax=Polistes dominula TaxID=743375 RepID=A0ABM1JCA8_POLDO|nr:PREDICTED: protein aubergine isoform X2 [Polistes dominula]
MLGGKGRGKAKSKSQPKTSPASAESPKTPTTSGTSSKTPTTSGPSPRKSIASGTSTKPLPIPSDTPPKIATTSGISPRKSITLVKSPSSPTKSGTPPKKTTTSGKSPSTPIASGTSSKIPILIPSPQKPTASSTCAKTLVGSGTTAKTPTASGKSPSTPIASSTSSKIPILIPSPQKPTASSTYAKTLVGSGTTASTPTASVKSPSPPTKSGTPPKKTTASGIPPKRPQTLSFHTHCFSPSKRESASGKSPSTPSTSGTPPKRAKASGKSASTPSTSGTPLKGASTSGKSLSTPTTSGTPPKRASASGKSASTPSTSGTPPKGASASGKSLSTPTASGTPPKRASASGKSPSTPIASSTSSKIPILTPSPQKPTASSTYAKALVGSGTTARTPTTSGTSPSTPITSSTSAKTPTTLDISDTLPKLAALDLSVTSDTSARIPTTSGTSNAPSECIAPKIPVWPREPTASLEASTSQLSLSESPVLSQPISLQSRPTHLELSKPGPSSQPSLRGRGDRRKPFEGSLYESQVPDVRASGDTSFGRGAIRGRRFLCTDSLLVTRPENLPTKKGVTGNQIMLQSNYFKLPCSADWTLFQFRVDFAPEEDSIHGRKKLLKLHKEKLGVYIFDGTVLYTTNRLPKNMDLLSIRETDSAKIQITVKFAREVPKNDFYYLQFFNLIMRKCLEFLNLQLVGRNFYDPHNKIDISQFKLELWPGYFTAIKEHEQNILMCAEITHKVMRQETLLDIWINCLETDDKPMQVFTDLVKGTVVLTGYNNNTYSIQDIDFQLNPKSTFKLKSGESISYQDYYRDRYQLRVSYANQPLLIAKPKQKIRTMNTNVSDQMIYLVPEFCRATGLTEKMRSNFNLMQTLSAHTRVSPEARIKKLLHFNRRLCSEPNVISELKNWNLKLESKLIDVPARVLPAENICFGTRSKSTTLEANWTKELRFNKLVTCTPLDNWVLIQTEYTQPDSKVFVKNLIQAAEGMGFIIRRPEEVIIRDDRYNTYVDAIETYLSKKRPQFVFCILPQIRSDRYGAIKKKCCVDRPIPSQVIVKKNLIKGGLSVSTKVAIQINCKLGGVPWYVEIPLQGLMVVGFDVCHSKQSGNYAATVASINNNLSRYVSAVSAHTYGEELSNDISAHIYKFVMVYRSVNKTLPDRIVIYRDGVGEGQIEQVYQHEVKHIRQSLQKLYKEQVVRLAVIIVNKRVNSRLFYRERNPPPGTVVDDVITNRVKYDFFIVSQNVKQGTVTPTSYSVIDDNVGLDADKMQRLTYKLTHMYYNWSGTVRVPAPCQYAHKLAYLISENIKTIPSVRLEQLLYFL